MIFFITTEIYNLEYIFFNLAISCNSRNGTSIFSPLVLLLIYMLMHFLFFLSLFVKVLAISGRQKVKKH